MFKFIAASLTALAICCTVNAKEFQYSYVEAGLSFASDTDRNSNQYGSEKLETIATAFNVRGSVGFGSFFYMPASMEFSVFDYEERECDNYYDYCFEDEYTVSEMTFSIGAGIHADIGDVVSIYGDLSRYQTRYTIDLDGGYDSDDDYHDDDSSLQKRVGVRIAPIDLLDLDLSRAKRDYFYTELKTTLLRARFNITQHIGVGAEIRRENTTFSDAEALNYYGAFFRYSF